MEIYGIHCSLLRWFKNPSPTGEWLQFSRNVSADFLSRASEALSPSVAPLLFIRVKREGEKRGGVRVGKANPTIPLVKPKLHSLSPTSLCEVTRLLCRELRLHRDHRENR